MLAHRGSLGTLGRTDGFAEEKADGTRNHIKWTPTSLEMWSRDSSTNDYRVNYAEVHNLPEVEADIQKLREKHKSGWLDVELAWYNKQGRSIMRGSQVRCGTSKPQAVREKMLTYPINAVAFDLLELDGTEYMNEPYIVRKAMLQSLIDEFNDLRSLRYMAHTTEVGELWQHQLNIGGEGVMWKSAMHKYEFRRSKEWLKLKNEQVTDGKEGRPLPMKIVGYTAGEGERTPYFGSLVLQNEDGTYGGNVGGGFNTQELAWWTNILQTAQRIDKPFDDKQVGNSYTAIKIPHRVLVRYYEKTVNNVLRFPTYQGIAQ